MKRKKQQIEYEFQDRSGEGMIVIIAGQPYIAYNTGIPEHDALHKETWAQVYYMVDINGCLEEEEIALGAVRAKYGVARPERGVDYELPAWAVD